MQKKETIFSDDKPLAIGFLRRGYSSTGGAEAYLSRLAAGLKAAGSRVVLLGTGDWPQEKWPGGEVVVLPKKSLRAFGEAALRVKKEKTLDLLFSMERVPGVDIFRAGDGVHAAWLQHQKIMNPWWRRWFSFFRHREVLSLEKKLFEANSQTRVIANSAMVAKEITERFCFPASQISIIPNGVPAASLPGANERAEARKKLGFVDDVCVALFVGSGWKRKGLEVALKAVELANKVQQKVSIKLLVAGKGSSKRYASEAAIFLGPMQRLESLYAAADFFILPTIYDPFSNASLEALAAGLPVITSAMNGCSEVINERVHGSVIRDPKDVDSFVKILQYWQQRLQEKQEAVLIHQACAARGAEFSVEKNLQATLEVIDEVLKKN